MAASCVPYSGLFVCGARPLWLFASRGGLVAHPHAASDGPVAAMAPFHNANCPRGLILAAPTADLRVCHLPAQLRLDGHWLAAKVPLKATPLRAAWCPEAKLLALLARRAAAPRRPLLPEEAPGDPTAAAAYAAADAAGAASGVEELCELRLVAPPGSALTAAATAAARRGGAGGAAAAARPGGGGGSGGGGGLWHAPTLWRYPLLPREDGLAVKSVALRDFASGAGDEAFVAVGTGSPLGEDYPALGRVLLFQITRETRVDLDGGREDAVAGRLALWRELAGPVVAVEALRGYLLVAVGPRLEMHYKQVRVCVWYMWGEKMEGRCGLLFFFACVVDAARVSEGRPYNMPPRRHHMYHAPPC